MGDNKVDRVIKMAKAARTEMVQLSSGDLEFEEQVINFFGLQDNLTEYLDLLKNCDSYDSQESKEKVAKGRGIIKEVNESFKAVNLEDTTKQMVLEKESFKTLDKPESFAHAQEIEKEAVLFAKEVR